MTFAAAIWSVVCIGHVSLRSPLIPRTIERSFVIGSDAAGSCSQSLFKWVSFFLYGVYAVFVVLALNAFGDRIGANFTLDVPTDGWASAGITYAGYNIVGAVILLPAPRPFVRTSIPAERRRRIRNPCGLEMLSHSVPRQLPAASAVDRHFFIDGSAQVVTHECDQAM